MKKSEVGIKEVFLCVVSTLIDTQLMEWFEIRKLFFQLRTYLWFTYFFLFLFLLFLCFCYFIFLKKNVAM